MKKNLFPLLLLGGLFSVSVQAQNAHLTVSNSGSVYVGPAHGVHVEGADAAGLGVLVTGGGSVVSEAPITMNGSYQVDPGAVFHLTYQDANADTAYGQLIQAETAVANTGLLTIRSSVPDRRDIDNSSYVEMSFPFVSEDLGVVIGRTFNAGGAPVTSTDRNTQYAWAWNNEYAYNSEVLGTVDPALAYTLNLTNSQMASNLVALRANAYVDFTGVANHASTSLSLKRQKNDAGVFLNTMNLAAGTEVNKYSERYSMYLYDPTYDKANVNAATYYAQDVYYITNPFPSNISLTKLFEGQLSAADIQTLAYLSNQQGTAGSGNGSDFQAAYYRATCSGAGLIDGANCVGDLIDQSINEIYIRPTSSMTIKLVDDYFRNGGTDKTLTYNDAVKTSAYDGLINFGTPVVIDPNASTKTTQSVAVNSGVEELRLELLSEGSLVSKVYLAANPTATQEIDTKMDAKIEGEAVMSILAEGTNDRDLYINGISMDQYIAKPIYLTLNTVAGKAYSFDSKIRLGLDRNLATSNFFLEDTKANKIMQVNAGFTYDFVASSDDANRFVAYYGGIPADLNDKVAVDSYLVQVAKSGTEDFVVFKGVEGKAKVYVYNVLGQLVLSDENVDATQNYSLASLPSNSGVYLVKIVTNQGTTTKKIVK